MEDVVTGETDKEDDVVMKEERFKGQNKMLDSFIVYISISLGISACFHLNPRCEVIDSQVFGLVFRFEDIIFGSSIWDFDIGIWDLGFRFWD